MATVTSIAKLVVPSTTNTKLYQVGSGNRAVLSSLGVCNVDTASATSFRIFLVLNNTTAAQANAIYYDLGLPASDTFVFTGGITLGPQDAIWVYGSSGKVNFFCFGEEIEP